jgi:glycerophosphoryl diester phosphodiesterase
VKRIFKLLLIVSFFSCSSPNKDPLIIGHRGAMGHVTENTIPSIKKAIELGVDGIEIDVFKCKSGEIVVFHDKKLDRLTNSSGYIEDLSYDSINKIKVMGKYRIPQLIEVIDILPNEIFLNIELKGEETVKKVNEIITEFINRTESKLDRFIISSFNWKELEKFRLFNSKIPIAVLTDTTPLNAISVAKKLNAVAINPNYKLLNKNTVNEIKKEGLKIFPYTVNSLNDIDKMKTFRVDGIITDYPERIK